MQIGNVNTRHGGTRLCLEQRKRYMEEKLCFACAQQECRAIIIAREMEKLNKPFLGIGPSTDHCTIADEKDRIETKENKNIKKIEYIKNTERMGTKLRKEQTVDGVTVKICMFSSHKERENRKNALLMFKGRACGLSPSPTCTD